MHRGMVLLLLLYQPAAPDGRLQKLVWEEGGCAECRNEMSTSRWHRVRTYIAPCAGWLLEWVSPFFATVGRICEVGTMAVVDHLFCWGVAKCLHSHPHR